MPGISVLCGLGNPGRKYSGTRHNLGMIVLDILARRHGLSWREAGGPVLEAFWRSGGNTVRLLKPQNYMNRSGAALFAYGGLEPGAMLVVTDDINLPLGRLRFRESGGSGGHKGLDSIIEIFGTEGFARLRPGIGAPPAEDVQRDYVLEEFGDDERIVADRVIAAAADAIELALGEGLQAAMSVYNGTDLAGDDV